MGLQALLIQIGSNAFKVSNGGWMGNGGGLVAVVDQHNKVTSFVSMKHACMVDILAIVVLRSFWHRPA